MRSAVGLVSVGMTGRRAPVPPASIKPASPVPDSGNAVLRRVLSCFSRFGPCSGRGSSTFAPGPVCAATDLAPSR